MPALLSAVREPDTDDNSGRVIGAMFVLQKMLRGPVPDARVPLSEPSRDQISKLAEELLEKSLRCDYVISIGGLVLATGREDLRQQLEQLATDSNEWRRRGLTDVDLIVRSQDIIRSGLRLYPRP